jgi:heterotetrameric sarcosine oxidase gamma subunit
LTQKDNAFVPKPYLASQAVFGELDSTLEGLELTAPTGLSLVSIATPSGGRGSLEEALLSIFGVQLPRIGASGVSSDGGARLLGLQANLIFVLFDNQNDGASKGFIAKLDRVAYCTDQSDGWCYLRVSGPGLPAMLERICMLDLEHFPIGAVTRTTMEGLGVIILREGADEYLLMSPRSSAASFLRSIERSIAYTL